MRAIELIMKTSPPKDVGIWAAFSVSNAKQLFLEYQAKQVPFWQTLTREPWHGQGQGSFIVQDPDRNLLLFGGRTD